MSGRKCRNCGSTDIDFDSGRGDAVCTNCGTVLEDTIIVSEVQFEENAHGASSAIGHFVAADSKGGATGYGASFHVGIGTESREITLRKARQGISTLCHQLRLNNHCIDTACNFFKMALSRQLTRGRKNTHIHAACVYITCRTEGTAHLLIDISDVLQICCYELGRTYLRLSQALCINIPSIDPCLYILRFANRLDFGEKTHEVSMTALRLVQRMKRDSIHSGRRPSGLCGAALLIAARMHDYNRLPTDIVRIVKVHESTLRKRLLEFGDTPSSALTLEEFMTVDLEAEQDPPAFKEARKKDKERITKLSDKECDDFSELQKEIDKQLEKDLKKSTKRKVSGTPETDIDKEFSETNSFIKESTMGLIKECLDNDAKHLGRPNLPPGLGPDLVGMCLAPTVECSKNLADNLNTAMKSTSTEAVDLDLEGINDDEIDSYIMTPNEAKYKDGLWNQVNATYLLEQKAREEKLAKEKEEGKPEKKKRRTGNKKKSTIGPSNTAGEAIEKMLQEKKISNKINYDILKSLSTPLTDSMEIVMDPQHDQINPSEDVKDYKNIIKPLNKNTKIPNFKPRKEKTVIGLPLEQMKPPVEKTEDAVAEIDLDEADYYEDPEPVPKPEHTSLAAMLNDADEDNYYSDDY